VEGRPSVFDPLVWTFYERSLCFRPVDLQFSFPPFFPPNFPSLIQIKHQPLPSYQGVRLFFSICSGQRSERPILFFPAFFTITICYRGRFVFQLFQRSKQARWSSFVDPVYNELKGPPLDLFYRLQRCQHAVLLPSARFFYRRKLRNPLSTFIHTVCPYPIV